MSFPELSAGDVCHPPPEIGLCKMFLPIPEILFVEGGHLRRHPGFGMDAVGDAGDRHFVARHSGPDIFPKTAAHVTVQFTDAVRMPARPERENGHAESIERIHARLPT